MGHPRLIAPPPGSTPANLTPSRTHRRELPEDLLREASKRLGIIALIAFVLWAVGTVLYHLAKAQTEPSWYGWQNSDIFVVVGALASIAVFFYTRMGDRDPRVTMDIGLAYLVVTAALIGLMSHWDTPPDHYVITPLVSWIGAMVIIVSAVLPSTPIKMLIAGTLSVSMNPIAMLIARARNVWDFGPISNVIVMHYQDYMLVCVAAVITMVVARLGQEVAKAREMGSYQLGELIGRGGMGEVYRATHRMLARPAAIKLIRPEMIAKSDSESAGAAASRFKREATSAANLRSPHTVELYDFGITDDGTMYFAMELLEGMDLESMVRRTGPLPAARVIHILQQVCASLAEAHASGLVHRDIKPANIHVGRLGLVNDFVKVLDFGLVKSVMASGVTHTQATGLGTTPGTPAYMAPEVALGEPIDGRTDLYSLGGVAYFLLTGQLVFEGEGLQMIVKRLNADPIPPSDRTELPIPNELERLVLSCLARTPANRPASASELARALDAIPIAPWTAEQATTWWRVNGQ